MPENEKQVEHSQEFVKKKDIKYTVNILVKGLLFYLLTIFILMVFYDLIISILTLIVGKLMFNSIESKAFTDQATSSYIPYLISILIGVLCLRKYFNNLHLEYTIINTKKRMTLKSFLLLLCVFMSVQLVFAILNMGAELGLNQIGFSIADQMANVSKLSTTISMFLYISFLGPIAEEIIFRGFIMRGLEKYGKLYAIVLSSIIFGAYHGNAIQGVSAAAVGLVLGYVAMEYSIYYSILMHIINNFIFCQVSGYIMKQFSTSVQTIFFYSIYGIFFIAAIIILIIKRTVIKDYIRTNKSEKGLYRYSFSALWMIIFLLIEILVGISGIKKI